jgi:hypothetical protein
MSCVDGKSGQEPIRHLEVLLMASTRTKVQLVTAITVLLILSSLVYGTSRAAFSATTTNPANSWDSGTVTLTDSQAGTALFASTNMVPGDQINNCVEVTYGGNSYDLTPIRFYATVTDGGLADDLDVVVDEVDDCTTKSNPGNVFTGPLTTISADYTLGDVVFTPTSGDTMRGYDITVTLGTDTLNTEQNMTADADFTWEVRTDDTTP